MPSVLSVWDANNLRILPQTKSIQSRDAYGEVVKEDYQPNEITG